MQPGESDHPAPDASWHETDWSAWIARERGAKAEHKTADGSRVDVLTDGVAYEVEYADKWQQAVGQALFYSAATGRAPGIILLIGKRSASLERVYYLRCLVVCHRHGIKLETVQMKALL